MSCWAGARRAGRGRDQDAVLNEQILETAAQRAYALDDAFGDAVEQAASGIRRAPRETLSRRLIDHNRPHRRQEAAWAQAQDRLAQALRVEQDFARAASREEAEAAHERWLAVLKTDPVLRGLPALAERLDQQGVRITMTALARGLGISVKTLRRRLDAALRR